MKIRIGIDVGGTFTDAAAIDNDTFELIGTAKVPTTHTAPEGVAAGIVQVLHRVMQENRIHPNDVVFIAHGTTQATNALLEGDVAKVGILTLGSGLEGAKSRMDTTMGSIELAAGKFLSSGNAFVDAGAVQNLPEAIRKAVQSLTECGASSIVAAEAFSVDNPDRENEAVRQCTEMGIPATATNDVSKLYGLKVRTRTAVVNASIMPKMLEAATMTEQSIQNAGITSPLMVMRCDGGVMTVDEVRSRPILTILSGPAAGVAGALMYEKLTDGIFFEVGGTSTDISCVKDGKVMIRYAQVGGHKTYLNSLDVRTVGIGGGSMVQIKDGKAVDTGPRSAHIANLDYEVYTSPERIVEPHLCTVRPSPTDPEYACVECAGGLRLALTMAGAANIAGYVPAEDYAHGSSEAARKAWQPLADSMGCDVVQAAQRVLAFAAKKNAAIAAQLIEDYHMDAHHTVFVGGGGGASAVVPHLARTMGHSFRIAHNAPVISTIGVALAMVRETVERTVANPTDEDILRVRREAEQRAVKSGAAPGTVEVSLTVDTKRNLVRAIAVGATELRSKNLLAKKLSEEQQYAVVAKNMDLPADRLYTAAFSSAMRAVQCRQVEKKLFGLLHKKTYPLRIIDEEGVIRLQRKDATVLQSSVKTWREDVSRLLNELTEYNDGGVFLPGVYLVIGKRIVDLSGVPGAEQMYGLGAIEMGGYAPEEPVIAAGVRRSDR